MSGTIGTLSGGVIAFHHRDEGGWDVGLKSVYVKDVAWGLANENRYANQTKPVYSVAQHSVILSHIVPASLRFEALIHDASEAFLRDIPGPLKTQLWDYKECELELMQALWTHVFDCPGEYRKHPVIDAFDKAIRFNEQNRLGNGTPGEVEVYGINEADDYLQEIWTPDEAFNAWWDRYVQLR